MIEQKNRKQNSILKIAGIVICMLAGLTIANTAHADVQYQIINLGIDYQNDFSSRFDLNDSGQVVGNYEYSAGVAHGFFWDSNSGMQDLGTLGSRTDSGANGINNNGEVVGITYDTTTNTHGRAVYWDCSGVTCTAIQDLGTLPGGSLGQAWAEKINDSGEIIGHSTTTNSTTSGLPYPTIWNLSGSTWIATQIDTSSITGSTYGWGGNINSAGNVVGQVNIGGGAWDPQAFYYDAGTGNVTDIGTLSGGSRPVVGYDINDNNDIVGFALASDGKNHAFYWDSSTNTMVDVGQIGDASTAASGLNSLTLNMKGEVVGNSANSSGDPVAFLWDDINGMRDLNDLVINGTGWELQKSMDINESGWIVGTGLYNGEERVYLLKVVPEPVSSSLFIVGGATLGFRRFWKKRRNA